jgi:hypothetical protein
MQDSTDRPRRFFISYRRRATADARLAEFLRERLTAEGCDVFVDVSMPVGIDWSAEIERRIEWCEFMVVLLSEDSIASEMVQAEVRRAHHASQGRERSKILPVRVAYEGPLGYELDGYLGKLQYALWRGKDDDKRIAEALLHASQWDALPALQVDAPIASAGTGTAGTPRPEPKADMRRLRAELEAPGSALGADNRFYVRRDADARVEEFAEGRPRTLVIKSPSQTGKSSLLLRYLACCSVAGKRVAFVDLTRFGAVKSLSFPEFSAQLAGTILDELGLPGLEVPPFRYALALTNFMHDQVLSRVEGELVIAIDGADQAIGSPWQEDFYTALRSWDSNRTHPTKKARWGRLGLALVIATDPRMLIESGYTSPFNVTPPETLGSFTRPALASFNACYGNLLTQGQLDALHALLRGHPYLTPLAFYRLVYEECTFSRLCEGAAQEDGPFGDHLRSKLDRLYAAKLHEPMREIVVNGTLPANDRRLFYRLEAAGLVREDAGRIVASNEVYRRFFAAVL